jgi:hypothetical protein
MHTGLAKGALPLNLARLYAILACAQQPSFRIAVAQMTATGDQEVNFAICSRLAQVICRSIKRQHLGHCLDV